MGDGISFQTKRALLELDRDMGGRQEPQQPQEPTNNRVGGLSAAEAQARAFGISVDELRKRQAAKFQELMNKRKGYADGGRVNGGLEDYVRSQRKTNHVARHLFQGESDSSGAVGPTLQRLADRAKFQRNKRELAEQVFDVVAPLSLYAGEANAGFVKAAPYIQRLVSKLTKSGLSLDDIRDVLVKNHGATVLPNGVAVSPTPAIRSPKDIPSYLSVKQNADLPIGEGRLTNGTTVEVNPFSDENLWRTINHEATHAQALSENLPLGGGAGNFKGPQGYKFAPGEILGRSAEQQYLGVPFDRLEINQTPLGLMTNTENVFRLGKTPIAAEASKAKIRDIKGPSSLTPEEAYAAATAYAKSLKGRQRQALEAYTDTNHPLHAFNLNTMLRDSSQVSPDISDYVNNLDSVFKEAPRTDSPLIVYRGQPTELRGEQPGYVSTSIDKDVARDYAESSESYLPEGLTKDSFGRTFEIQVPEKTPLVNPDIKEYWSDQELLLPRNTSFSGPGNSLVRVAELPEEYFGQIAKPTGAEKQVISDPRELFFSLSEKKMRAVLEKLQKDYGYEQGTSFVPYFEQFLKNEGPNFAEGGRIPKPNYFDDLNAFLRR